MRVLIWHVHGSWTTSFVQGRHTYLLPVVPDRGPDGRGRARTWDWPPSAVELGPDELADAPIDVAVIQRAAELELAEKWLGGRRLGPDIPFVWLEHDLPQGRVNEMRHPAVDRPVAAVVHVTHTNALFWDTGSIPARVIEHGVPDRGQRWTGDVAAAGVAINEPGRRARVSGSDLLARFGRAAPVHLFGIGAASFAADLGDPPWLTAFDDLPQAEMHEALATRRCYVHPYRWTSLGLALVEAMMLGAPVVAVGTAEVPAAVPVGCGFTSTDVGALVDAVERLMHDDDLAASWGAAGRAHALGRFGLDRFLVEWNDLLEDLP